MGRERKPKIMMDNAIEMILYALMLGIYYMVDKQRRIQAALVRRSLRSGRRRPAER